MTIRRNGNGHRAGCPGSRRAPRSCRPEIVPLEGRILLTSAAAVDPSAYEQYMLALINRARANPAAEGQRLLAIAQSDPAIEAATAGWNLATFVQEISSYSPEPPLAFNTRLISAADDHDAAMLAANSQFHSPSGSLVNPSMGFVDSDGQAYLSPGNSSWATAENIFAYSGNVSTRSEQQVVDYFEEAFFLDWGNPDFGHLKNLLSPGPAEASATGAYPMSEIGVGMLTDVSPTVPPPATASLAGNQGLNVGPDLITEEFGWVQGQQFLTGVAYNDAASTQFYAPGEGLGGVQIQAVGQSGQGTFQTTTWNSGGYSLELPSGTYAVTATGGGLATAQTTSVTIGQDNVGWDVRATAALPTTPVAFTPPVAAPVATPPVAASPVTTSPSAPTVTTVSQPETISKIKIHIHAKQVHARPKPRQHPTPPRSRLHHIS